MKFLSFITIFAILFASAVGANESGTQANTVTQDPSTEAGEIQRDLDEQRAGYQDSEFDSEYYEGVRRNKQGVDETWEQREDRLKNERELKEEKDIDENAEDMSGEMVK